MDPESYNLEGKGYSYDPGRDYSWLGGSIEVLTSGAANVFAVCIDQLLIDFTIHKYMYMTITRINQ